MKKKMERLSDELFRPITVREGRCAFGGGRGGTPTTFVETNNPNPDGYIDGESHN
jgi:hypothetical protein